MTIKTEAIIPDLYRAAASPEGVAGALPRLAEAVGARAGSMWALGRQRAATPHQHVAVPGAPVAADSADSRLRHRCRPAPESAAFADRTQGRRSGMGQDAPPLQAALAESLLTEGILLAGEFYPDWAGPAGVRHVLGSRVPLGPDTVMAVAFQRPREMRAFRETERRRLDALLPHVQGALQVERRLRAAERRARAGFAALDALPFGVLVTDGAEAVVYANRRAEMLAQTGDLRLGGRPGIGLVRAADARALERLLHDVAHGGAGGLLGVDRPGRAPLAVLVSPLPSALDDAPEGAPKGAWPRALVLIREPGREPAFSSQAFARAYGLTPAEAAVAATLAQGLEPAGVAARQGVSLATVRSQIGAIRKKTECASLREFTRLLSVWEAVAPTA